MSTAMTRMRFLFTGVGGQGTLLASRLLGEAALNLGIPVLISEVHGMAQRGGVVESTVMLGGIKSPIISDGEADCLLGFEPLETIRALRACNKDSTIITNLSKIEPFTVKLGFAAYPDVDYWLGLIQERYKKVYACDAEEMAQQAGSAKAGNVVLLGVLAGSGVASMPIAVFQETIRRIVKPKTVDINLRAFELGFEFALKQSTQGG